MGGLRDKDGVSVGGGLGVWSATAIMFGATGPTPRSRRGLVVWVFR